MLGAPLNSSLTISRRRLREMIRCIMNDGCRCRIGGRGVFIWDGFVIGSSVT